MSASADCSGFFGLNGWQLFTYSTHPQFELNLFPNPALEQTKVSFKLNNESDVSVFDLAGKVVFTENTTNAAAGQLEVTISTTDLAAGVYTVNFAANNTIVTKKLVVRK